jgi:predicted alpha/beta-hydrolase family hydrolase
VTRPSDPSGRQAPSSSGTSSWASGLLLTPGAGGGREHSTLVAVEQAVAPIPCLRLDFPNRIAGRRAPDRPPVAIAHVAAAAAQFAADLGTTTEHLVLGGRSFGGRMCSMAVAQGLPVAGLVLLSYPLHPPGAPEKLRTEHFAQLDVPVLFVSGVRDPFGSPDEFAAHVSSIPGKVTTSWLPGGHDPRADSRVAATVADWWNGR